MLRLGQSRGPSQLAATLHLGGGLLEGSGCAFGSVESGFPCSQEGVVEAERPSSSFVKRVNRLRFPPKRLLLLFRELKVLLHPHQQSLPTPLPVPQSTLRHSSPRLHQLLPQQFPCLHLSLGSEHHFPLFHACVTLRV